MWLTHLVGNLDLRPIPHYHLHLGAQEDGARPKAGTEGFGELVEATSDFSETRGVKRGERVRVGGMRPACPITRSIPGLKGEETSFMYIP